MENQPCYNFESMWDVFVVKSKEVENRTLKNKNKDESFYLLTILLNIQWSEFHLVKKDRHHVEWKADG